MTKMREENHDFMKDGDCLGQDKYSVRGAPVPPVLGRWGITRSFDKLRMTRGWRGCIIDMIQRSQEARHGTTTKCR
jgi:hypothetical protein